MIELHEEYSDIIDNGRLFLILFRHRKKENISNGNKVTEVTTI